MIVVFADKATADAQLRNISETPGGVWVYVNPDNQGNDVKYAMGMDGRCAIAHEFSAEDIAYLMERLKSISGVQLLDTLPSDWEYPREI